MKNLNIKYLTGGRLELDFPSALVLEDESGVVITAEFPTEERGTVKAYIESNGESGIINCTETLTDTVHKASVTLSSEYIARGDLRVGFEVNATGYSTRYEPVVLEVPRFIDPTGSNPHGYTVTVSVGTVTSLPAGSAPTVENAGTGKDVVLNFGIPKGDKGDSADVVDNLTSTNTDKALSAKQGKVLDGKKVDKVSGKGLSTNDFTNAHKAAVDCLSYNKHDLGEFNILKMAYIEGKVNVLGDISAQNGDVFAVTTTNGTHRLSEKANAWTIQTAVTNNTLILAGGTETQLLSSDTASLTLTIPATISNSYECAFSFKSGATATTLVYAATPITWRGTDCDADGDFTPQANVSYEVSIKCLGKDADNNPVVVARVGAF